MKLKKIGKAFTSEFVGNGPSSYKKRIYRAAGSRRLRNTALDYESRGAKHSTKTVVATHREGDTPH
jgi:hypothetical protein